MLRVEHERWGQSRLDLRQAAISAINERTRERFFALYDIAGGLNATQVAKNSGRNHQTVHEWVKRYNAGGPDAIVYRHTGGRSPLLALVASDSFKTT